MYCRYLILFYMDFILHEILKYKLNKMHVLIFLHVVCFYFACYSTIIFQISRGEGGAVSDRDRNFDRYRDSAGIGPFLPVPRLTGTGIGDKT